jgi:succinate-acetate transporter protein
MHLFAILYQTANGGCREMAAGNTFGATALSSYGGWWITLGIIFTPGGFNIIETLKAADNGSMGMFYDSFGILLFVRHSYITVTSRKTVSVLLIFFFPLQGLFIFTFLLLTCTVKSTVAFFSLFFTVDIAFLLLGIGYLHRDAQNMPNTPIVKAGGFFALVAAFLAWYVALAGIADSSNSFFIIPVIHFPWSEKGRSSRRQKEV